MKALMHTHRCVSISDGSICYLLFAIGLTLFFFSCGSGGSSSPPPPPPPPYLSLTASPGAVTLTSAGNFSTTVKASTNASSTPTLTSVTLPSGITTTTTFPLTISSAGTQINFQADSTLADGSYVLTLNGQAGSVTATAYFTANLNAPPQIQYVEPSLVMLGTGELFAMVAGANFTSSSTVLFDGTAVSTIYEKPNLQFTLPNSAMTVAQVHTVQVSDPVYGQSNVATYQVYAPQPGPTSFVGQLTQYMAEQSITNSLVPDLNGDGRADLVMVAQDSNSPLLYLPVVRYGQANGTFSAATSLGTFTPQVSPGIVLAGDFNGDGYTDLILIGGNVNSQLAYEVLLNNGTGQFSSASTVLLPANATQTAVVGDFNHDGKLDFAYATSSGQFSFYFGNGDGTFTGPTVVGVVTGGFPTDPIAVDFNGDGYTDIAYSVVPLNSSSNQIRLLLSASNGSYTDSQIAGLPSPALAFTVADFNNDNIPDIFAVNESGMGLAYLGVGNGTFNPTGSPIQTDDGSIATPPLVAGDFDNDGNADVATRITLSGPNEIRFLWGDGTGNFTNQQIVSDQSSTLQVGDVNGDGIPDIFAGVTLGAGYPSVVLGQNGRNFPTAQVLIPNVWGQLSTGNVFNDGYTDLLVAGAYESVDFGTVPGTLYQYQTNGTFAAQGQAPAYQTLLFDLNGDGIADMVGLSGNNLLIWKGDGSGVYGAPVNQVPIPNAWQPIYFRDMDGDGNIDIVLPGVILYGEGNFQFQAVTIPYFQNFVVGDFNGDGIPDIATPSGVMFGQGSRTFTAPTGIVPLPDDPPPFPTQVAADMNGDGMDDLVLADSGFAIYLSVGTQGFIGYQSLVVNGYAASITSLAVADFNGDGLLDIAAGMIGADDVVIFTNDGTGKYEVTSYAIGVYAVYSVSASFSQTGKPDLAFLNYYFEYEPPTVTVLMHQ
jgi:hypothetical protein